MSMPNLSGSRILYLYSRLKPREETSDTLFAGGAQKRTFQMAVHFAGLCEGVWLGSDDDPEARIVTELEKRKVRHLRIPFRYGPLHAIRAYLRLLTCVRKNRIDVIHCNDRWTAMFGCLVRAATEARCVYSARNVFYDKRCSRWFWGDNIVAVSNAVRDNLIDVFGVSSHRVTVIYNGTDIQPSGAAERASLYARFGLSPDTPVLSVIGRLSRQKGHSVLLDAMETVKASHPNVRVLCVGDGELKDALQDKAARAGLGDCVTFCGFQDHVAAFIDISMFTVMPSLWEGMPGGVIESLVLGKPVVATPAGGITEIVKDGVNGLIVPCGDADRLAEAILCLLRDPDRVRTMSESARVGAGQQFTLRSMLSNYEEYYKSVLAERSGGRRGSGGMD